MQSNRQKSHSQPDFTFLSRQEAIDVLLRTITQTLLSFPSQIKSTFHEYAEQSDTIIEGFFNREFSHFFQNTIANQGYAGYFTYHDESANPMKLLNRGKKKGLEKQVDLGIRLPESRERILVIEGKRLHNKYDKQYVSGGTGGIARFKREEHGEDKDMSIACIVGYVQKETFAFWRKKINKWLEEEETKGSSMNWGTNESLSSLKTASPIVVSSNSIHQRLKLIPIKLHHFWVNVN